MHQNLILCCRHIFHVLFAIVTHHNRKTPRTLPSRWSLPRSLFTALTTRALSVSLAVLLRVVPCCGIAWCGGLECPWLDLISSLLHSARRQEKDGTRHARQTFLCLLHWLYCLGMKGCNAIFVV